MTTNQSKRPDLPIDVEGVRVLRSPDPDAGPRLAILGSVHGNEPCGLEAIDELAAAHARGDLPLVRGEVVLIHGNPAATRAGRRGSGAGTDLNRLFDFRFATEIPESEWVYEHHRAIALRPVLEACDAMLDLHSAGRPTPAFAIADDDPRSLELAQLVGIDWVITRWSGPGSIAERTTLGMFRRLRRPGVVVECGSHEAPETRAKARAASRRMLRALGLVDGPPLPSPDPSHRPTEVHVFDAAVKTDSAFRFQHALRGFDRLDPGEILGGTPDQPSAVRSPDEACWAVLPNGDVPVGKELVYFGRRADGGPVDARPWTVAPGR